MVCSVVPSDRNSAIVTATATVRRVHSRRTWNLQRVADGVAAFQKSVASGERKSEFPTLVV